MRESRGGPHTGVMLPTSDPSGRGTADIAAAAIHLERIGAETIWAGDHLAFHTPMLDSTIALATAAAVTSTSSIGTCVQLIALRNPAWAAKQIATLQAVSRGRFVLGVGVGGENPAEWSAAGVPLRERGRRTDVVLGALPDLLGGHPTHLGHPYDLDVPALLPAATMPPVWVGGRSDASMRRAARFGDGWLAMWVDERRVAAARARLDELALAEGRPPARIGMLVFLHVGGSTAERDAAGHFVGTQYRLPFEKVSRYVPVGDLDEVASHLAGLVEAGVDELVLLPATAEHRGQYDALGELMATLRA